MFSDDQAMLARQKAEYERQRAEQLQAQQDAAKGDEANRIHAGGYSVDDNQLRRESAYNYGSELGQKEFYDDPDMIKGREAREDLAKGYDSKQLGAMREEARGQIAGQRSSYLQGLKGNLARGGAGGARGAAVMGAADQKYSQQSADSERKLLLDSANMKTQGVDKLQDYIFRQKTGKLGIAGGQQMLSSADYAADKGVQAANHGGGKK